MDVFSKNKFLFWAMAILVVLNLTLITILAVGHFCHREHPPMCQPLDMRPDKFHAKDFISHELKLDETQKNQFEAILDSHFVLVDKIMEQIMKKRDEKFEKIFSNNSDEAQIGALAGEIGNLYKDLEIANSTHFLQLKKIIKPEQVDKLKELLKESIKFNRPGMQEREFPPCGPGTQHPGMNCCPHQSANPGNRGHTGPHPGNPNEHQHPD